VAAFTTAEFRVGEGGATIEVMRPFDRLALEYLLAGRDCCAACVWRGVPDRPAPRDDVMRRMGMEAAISPPRTTKPERAKDLPVSARGRWRSRGEPGVGDGTPHHDVERGFVIGRSCSMASAVLSVATRHNGSGILVEEREDALAHHGKRILQTDQGPASSQERGLQWRRVIKTKRHRHRMTEKARGGTKSSSSGVAARQTEECIWA